MQYVQRAVHSAQLSGEHQLATQKLDWALTSSGVQRDEPDRSEFVQAITQSATGGTETLHWLNTGNEGAVRTFSTLQRVEQRGKAQLSAVVPRLRPRARHQGRRTRSSHEPRRRHSRLFDQRAGRDGCRRRRSTPSRFSTAASAARATVSSRSPRCRRADRTTRATGSAPGYVMTEISLTERARLIGGARYEDDQLTIDAFSTLGSPVVVKKHWQDVLPSLALNYQLTGNAAASAVRDAKRWLARSTASWRRSPAATC